MEAASEDGDGEKAVKKGRHVLGFQDPRTVPAEQSLWLVSRGSSMVGMIPFAIAFFWALPHVGVWKALLFMGFCYILFFPLEMITGLPGLAIAEGLAKLFPPKDKESPLPSPSELRSRSKWSCFVGGLLTGFLGLWVLSRLGAAALLVPMLVALLAFEVAAYIDQLVYHMSALRWPVLKTVAYGLAYAVWTLR